MGEPKPVRPIFLNIEADLLREFDDVVEGKYRTAKIHKAMRMLISKTKGE